jgi:putative ATP-dependent endonuclease of OLD family
VIVATHSPNLSAWVESKKLVFFRSFLPAPADDAPDPAEDEAPPLAGVPAEIMPEIEPNPVMPIGRARRVTRCIPLAALALDPVERRKVDRYLDVTKSAFLFGGRVLLVEGIAEALLLPVMAKKIVLKDDADKLRLFRSAVFVPIDGVDFQPYAKLLLSPFNEVRIADRLVVLTDGDGGEVAEGAVKPGAARKRDLEALVAGLGATELLEVVINDYSLETELVRAGNAAVLKEVYLQLHPRSGDKWDAAIAQGGAAQAVAVQKLFETTRKGDFAQLLAEEINKGTAFIVPGYLKTAIEALVK